MCTSCDGNKVNPGVHMWSLHTLLAQLEPIDSFGLARLTQELCINCLCYACGLIAIGTYTLDGEYSSLDLRVFPKENGIQVTLSSQEGPNA